MGTIKRMTSSEAILTAENITYLVPGSSHKTPILKNLTFSIKKGEFCVLIGKNGSGKTSLCQILAGLLKPASGEVSLRQGTLPTDAAREPHNREGFHEPCLPRTNGVAGKVAAYLDDPDAQLIGRTVEEDVSFGPKNLGSYRKETVEELLALLNLAELRDSNPSELSAGEKVRVIIASLLAMRPCFLILDEPTSFLDPDERIRLGKILASLTKAGEIGVLLSTQYPSDIFLGERVLLLDQGSIVLDANAHAFLEKLGDHSSLGITREELFPFLADLEGAPI
ncbi:MAG: ABC transporter ATP-binding protein [Candidatus Eisenbacteria bacterium]|nr:ABC transporter ATP-binding protein [Candidatus Eisenbacteria bacterium]